MPVEPGTVNAPDFPAGAEWLNTDRPLSIKDLKGKIVLLDFWTYCCINCQHILPDLKRLEQKYGDFLVVIGVHSGKFLAEKDAGNIRQAILRHDIEHPVVNDPEMKIWSEYAVRAWPTMMLIDPRGKVIGTHSGEGVFEVFDPVIAQMAEHFKDESSLDRQPFTSVLEREREPASILSFPGKVLADADGGQLFIADTGHHRIIVASLDTGAVLDVIGTGEPGFTEGAFEEAQFRGPQGMALEGDLLYVADTENHAIRRVDLRSRSVVTIAGNGRQDPDFNNLPGPARGRPLNSPWDLDIAYGVMFIAMAGAHQIWGLDLEEFYIAGHAGSGDEDHRDGPLLGASMAQPSGLTHDENHLFVADSETSSIRAVNLDPRGGHVKTVVGEGLFDFGDVDGGPDVARLQHPLDVEYAEGTLFVADTYNNKIKAIGLHTRSSRTFAGDGFAGLVDGAASHARFDEPGGLSSADGNLYVADTNNHAIRMVNIASGDVSTFALRDADRLALPRRGVKKLTPVRCGVGSVTLSLDLDLPEDTRLNPDVASQIEVVRGGETTVLSVEALPVETRVEVSEGETVLTIKTAVYWCRAGQTALCCYSMETYELTLLAEPSGPGQVSVVL
jgi:sugar lactone lactonase YvrE